MQSAISALVLAHLKFLGVALENDKQLNRVSMSWVTASKSSDTVVSNEDYNELAKLSLQQLPALLVGLGMPEGDFDVSSGMLQVITETFCDAQLSAAVSDNATDLEEPEPETEPETEPVVNDSVDECVEVLRNLQPISHDVWGALMEYPLGGWYLYMLNPEKCKAPGCKGAEADRVDDPDYIVEAAQLLKAYLDDPIMNEKHAEVLLAREGEEEVRPWTMIGTLADDDARMSYYFVSRVNLLLWIWGRRRHGLRDLQRSPSVCDALPRRRRPQAPLAKVQLVPLGRPIGLGESVLQFGIVFWTPVSRFEALSPRPI